MRLGLKKEVMEAIASYAPVLEKMPVKELNVLLESITQMEKCGIDGFGYRIIDKEGNSAVFSTSCAWRGIDDRDPLFLKQMSDHMNYEVLYTKRNKLEYITRSRDKLYTPYLENLDKYGLNNSIINHRFHKDKIEIFYYISGTSNPDQRDVILNYLEHLNILTSNISSSLKIISSSKEFQSQKTPILEKSTINQLWKNSELICSRKKIEVNFNKFCISLTIREAQCLSLLGLGCDNKYIAKKLGISKVTVKDYVYELKDKLMAENREELIRLAQSSELKHIQNIMR